MLVGFHHILEFGSVKEKTHTLTYALCVPSLIVKMQAKLNQCIGILDYFYTKRVSVYCGDKLINYIRLAAFMVFRKLY